MKSTSNQTYDDISERVRLWRVTQNLTQSQASNILEIERSYLSQIERGRMPGRGLRSRFESMIKASTRGGVPAFGPRYLPLLSWAQAGQVMEAGKIPGVVNDYVASDIADADAIGVRLRGDSMEPKYSDGDIAILLPNSAPTTGETVVAHLRDQGVFCKILHIQPEHGQVKLTSYNPAYPPAEYRREDFHWIFPVAAIVKQLRQK